MTGLLLAIFILFCTVAFLAAAEMAFISVQPVRLREQAEKANQGAKLVGELRADSQHFLGVILIANNMTQVALAALLSYLFEYHFSIQSELIAALIIIPLMLVFCEVLPKEYARLHSLGFLMWHAHALNFLYRLLYMPAHAFIRLTEILFPNFKEKHEKIFMNEVEFKALVAESEKKGMLDPHERDFVNMILDFERTSVRSVMIPLVQVAQVELRSDISDVRQVARDKGDRMVLVYEDDPSIVVGVIYVFDVLSKDRENGPLNDFLKAPLFISEKMPLEEAFQLLKRKRQSFALVTDDQYEVVGVATVENLLLGKQA